MLNHIERKKKTARTARTAKKALFAINQAVGRVKRKLFACRKLLKKLNTAKKYVKLMEKRLRIEKRMGDEKSKANSQRRNQRVSTWSTKPFLIHQSSSNSKSDRMNLEVQDESHSDDSVCSSEQSSTSTVLLPLSIFESSSSSKTVAECMNLEVQDESHSDDSVCSSGQSSTSTVLLPQESCSSSHSSVSDRNFDFKNQLGILRFYNEMRYTNGLLTIKTSTLNGDMWLCYKSLKSEKNLPINLKKSLIEMYYGYVFGKI